MIDKPIRDILRLINSVSDTERIQNGRNRQIFSFNDSFEPVCFILHDGVISLYRDQDNLLIGNVSGPAIVGLNSLDGDKPGVSLFACGEIRYELVSKRFFSMTISNLALWESLSIYYMYIARLLTENHFNMVGLSTYQLICNCLLRLNQEDDRIRSTISAAGFIREKTFLSRSNIMKVLGDLKAGGYIEMDKGKLIRINNLPPKY